MSFERTNELEVESESLFERVTAVAHELDDRAPLIECVGGLPDRERYERDLKLRK